MFYVQHQKLHNVELKKLPVKQQIRGKKQFYKKSQSKPQQMTSDIKVCGINQCCELTKIQVISDYEIVLIQLNKNQLFHVRLSLQV